MGSASGWITARRIIAATHNPGKVRELRALLQPWGCDIISAGDAGLAEPDETEDSFRGNAILKAEHAARTAGLPALADDSGLEVRALGGAPGVLSARWGGPEKDFGLAMRKVWQALQDAGAQDRSARFVCALALAAPDRATLVFEGVLEGEIVWPPRGQHGFGYDPIFQPVGHVETLGEMDPARKHAISHRAQAFAALSAAVA